MFLVAVLYLLRPMVFSFVSGLVATKAAREPSNSQV
jgi:hypothetical protein